MMNDDDDTILNRSWHLLCNWGYVGHANVIYTNNSSVKGSRKIERERGRGGREGRGEGEREAER